MGLDIYFFKVNKKHQNKKSIQDTLTNAEKEYVELHKSRINELKNEWSVEEHDRLVRDIKEFCHCNSAFYDYYYKDPSNKTKESFDAWADDIAKLTDYIHPTGYFRKVNFIYAYFADRHGLEDEMYSWVTKEDLKDIINRCASVLADHSMADKLLPTCSGCFFGSTEYNEYYFNDVNDVLQQLGNILSEWGDDEIMLVEMSY